MREAPTAGVIRAFGGDPSGVVALDGGEGTSWRAGDIVLKPAGPLEELRWVADFVESLDVGDAVRVARYVRASAGEYIVEGWAATEWLEGCHLRDRWQDTLATARAFHEAAARASAAWPVAMGDREDPWSRATRVAWAEEPLPPLPPAAGELVHAMVGLARNAPSSRYQVIHSDLAGNVLFADDWDLPPAVIDISPQFRTVGYAEGILVADAVAWDGARLDFAQQFVDESPSRRADIARAIIFRVATAALFPNTTPARVDGEAAGYRQLVPILSVGD